MTPYYQKDGITIYHGDCREVLPEIPRGFALVTDPPYGLGGMLKAGTNSEWSRHFCESPEWDCETVDDAVQAAIAAASSVVLWGGNYYHLPPCRGWLLWDKMQEHTSAHAEMAWTNLDIPVRVFRYCRAQLASEGKQHPTQKPLPLMKWCIDLMKLPQSTVVVDPFLGSGTTLRAAKDAGLQAIGIEQNERYCEIAANRLAQGVLEFSA